MKKYALFLLGLLLSLLAPAQDQVLLPDSVQSVLGKLLRENAKNQNTNMNLEFYTSMAAGFREGSLDETAFKMNRVRLEIRGNFHEKFSYHFRQSFNKYTDPHSVDNISNNIEYAYVKWQVSPLFALIAGKQLFRLGGYEYWVNGVKVREFSDFNNSYASHQTGVGGQFSLGENHNLHIQLLNNRNSSYDDTYIYGLPSAVEGTKIPMRTVLHWNGYFADRKLFLTYGIASGELAKRKGELYLTAGHLYKNGPLTAYFDVMYTRQGLDRHGLISELQTNKETPATLQNVEYLSLIGDVDFRIHDHWNLYVKGAYETGNIFKTTLADGLPAGSYYRSWNAQFCVEYFPMKESELYLFAHFLYKGYNLTDRAKTLMGACLKDTQRVSLGLVYIIPVL